MNSSKQTLLHLSAQAGQEENVRCLLSRNAVINAQNLSGKTPLFLAVLQGHHTVVQCLLKKGADCTISSSDDQETVLHVAAFYGHTSILQDLLKDPKIKKLKLIHAKDSDGKTPLHKAVWGAPKPGVVQLLLDQGSDPNEKNKYDYTPLHWACRNGHVESLDLLVKKGAKLDVVNANNDTPLDLAVLWGKTGIFHYLLGTDLRAIVQIGISRDEKLPEDMEGYFLQCLIEAQKNEFFEEQIICLLEVGYFCNRRGEIYKAAQRFNEALALLQKCKASIHIEQYLLRCLSKLKLS